MTLATTFFRIKIEYKKAVNNIVLFLEEKMSFFNCLCSKNNLHVQVSKRGH